MSSPDSAIISEMLHQAAPMVRNFACNSGLDFDDLLQEAALVVVETLPKIAAGVRVYAYLQKAIQYHLIDLLRGRRLALSIDELVTAESDLTYADLLATPTPVVHDEQSEDSRDDVLYAALHALPLEEQCYLREVYDLYAFTPAATSPANEARSRDSVRICAFKRLRRNTALREAVCHE